VVIRSRLRFLSQAQADSSRGSRRAPSIHSMEMGTLVFAICLQLGAVLVLWTMVNNHLIFFQTLKTYISSSRFRAGFLILPFLLLYFSRDMVAGALYNAGSTDKLANARKSDAALDCCLSIPDFIAGIGQTR
jgi:hypothetical protein